MAESSTPVTLGVFLPCWEDHNGLAPSWGQIRELAVRAEEAGLAAIWLPDHILITPQWGYRDAWTLLAALAETTSRIQIGTLVTCTGFREPTLLALMASTLDEISGGRLVLGLGSGYPSGDLSWQNFGYAGDHPVGRFAEAVEIIVRLLRGETLTYTGKYYRTVDAVLRLRGPRSEGPPIWIGGPGPKVQRVAVQWASAVNIRVHPNELEQQRETFARLDQMCRAEGRDPATLQRTGFGIVSLAQLDELPGRFLDPTRTGPFSGSPEEIALQLRDLGSAGVTHMACIVDDGLTPGPLIHYPALSLAGFERFLHVAAALQRLQMSPSQTSTDSTR